MNSKLATAIIEAKALTSGEIKEIGKTLCGKYWRHEMPQGVELPRQSISYYLKSGGVNGAQAAAVIELIARTSAKHSRNAKDIQIAGDAHQSRLDELLLRFDLA